MKKRHTLLVATIAAGLGAAATVPAIADKPLKGTITTDLHGKDNATGCGGTKEKHCQPWVDLPAWPVAAPNAVTAIGGHFHITYETAGTIEQVVLVSENLVYSNPGGCTSDLASGTITLEQREPDAINPLFALQPPHRTTTKETKTFDVDYVRTGGKTLLVAEGTSKDETITATLTFHAKDTPAGIVARCITGQGGPLKIFFEIKGQYRHGP